MIHAYPPGARLPKNMSVASLKSPSAVALIAGAETGHSSPTDFATVDRGPSEPTTTFPWKVPRFVSTPSPRTRTTVVSVMSSAPSCTACAAIPWSILSRRTVKPRNGMSYRRPFGDQIRMTGVSISRTRYGTSMRSSSSVTVGKIARTSSLWATYSPHWTGTPISFRLSTSRTFSPRRAAYRAGPLPQARAVPVEVVYVVVELEGDAEMHPVPADRLDALEPGPGDEPDALRRRHDRKRGLARDDVDVRLRAHARVEGVAFLAD